MASLSFDKMHPSVTAYLSISVLLNFLALAAVACRIRVRLTTTQLGIGLDDVLIVIALPMAVALVAILGVFGHLGIGYTLTKSEHHAQWPVYAPLNFTFYTIYNPCMYIIKCSILCFYLRIFGFDRRSRTTIYVALAVIVLCYIVHHTLSLVICYPIQSLYNANVGGNCPHLRAISDATSAMTIATDLLVMAVPLPRIWALQMGRPEKIALTMLFLLGLLVTAVSSIRYYYVYRSQLLGGDWAGTVGPPLFLACVEANLAIFTCSMPVLRPMFITIREKWGGRGNASSSREYEKSDSSSAQLPGKFSATSTASTV